MQAEYWFNRIVSAEIDSIFCPWDKIKLFFLTIKQPVLYFWKTRCKTCIQSFQSVFKSFLQSIILRSLFDKWDAGTRFLKACEVKEFKSNCSRNVLNIYDHTVAVSDQKRDGEHLTVLQSPMRTDYHAAHVLVRKPFGSSIKVRHVHTWIWCIML